MRVKEFVPDGFEGVCVGRRGRGLFFNHFCFWVIFIIFLLKINKAILSLSLSSLLFLLSFSTLPLSLPFVISSLFVFFYNFVFLLCPYRMISLGVHSKLNPVNKSKPAWLAREAGRACRPAVPDGSHTTSASSSFQNSVILHTIPFLAHVSRGQVVVNQTKLRSQ